LYGLKHALKAWYSRVGGYLQNMGFTKSEADPNLYYIFVGSDQLVLVLYVDVLFLTSVEKLIVVCKANMAVEFDMKDIDMMLYFFGSREIFLGQGKYAVEIL
jgi:hypothetical protein